jgi:hypothetical protein
MQHATAEGPNIFAPLRLFKFQAMKTCLQSSNLLPPWQQERKELLQKACQRVSWQIQSGTGFTHAVREIAKCYHRRRFKTDPSRRLKLSEKTLIRLFYAWRDGGRKPGVFRLKYLYRQSLFADLALLRFADFLLKHRNRSFEKNWKMFSRNGGNFGRRRRLRQRAINAALEKTDQISLMAENYFRPKTSQAYREPDFQI